MKAFPFIVFFTLLSCSISAVEHKCPSTDIKPCTCRTYFDHACVITCSLASQADVEKIADIPNLCNGNVHFVLHTSKIDGIPAKLWKVLLSSKTVDVTIMHAGIKGLVPPGTESIPKVSTPGEAVIVFEHSKVEEWDWKQLANFHSEKKLHLIVDDTPLSKIGEDFKSIANGQVHELSIESTGLSYLQDKQFASFPDLSSLSLQNNKLTSISRSILAKPAKSLKYLHLNGNELTSLPGDLFSEMPVLEIVYLRDNKLVALPEDLFKSASASLKHVDLEHNPLNCNCQLMWILKNTKTHVLLGKCAAPEELRDKKVSDLINQLEC